MLVAHHVPLLPLTCFAASIAWHELWAPPPSGSSLGALKDLFSQMSIRRPGRVVNPGKMTALHTPEYTWKEQLRTHADMHTHTHTCVDNLLSALSCLHLNKTKLNWVTDLWSSHEQSHDTVTWQSRQVFKVINCWHLPLPDGQLFSHFTIFDNKPETLLVVSHHWHKGIS